MATLQKFKLLATQCAAPAASPSRSPGPAAAVAPSSPAFRLRRRRSLRTLLGRASSRRATAAVPGKPPPAPDRPSEKRALLSHSLADLFVSSPPPGGAEGGHEPAVGAARRFGFDVLAAGGPRFGSRGLRYRLLRRTWRPVLVAIPE
ncbi:hypothetical protein MUK42_35253 [Musa troglodytarum]|uniref:Uncharacterized protein n=1 Tax=Musa troglodytarum TaxID=320322 RepID=A0A9E7JBK9_9LILI|nr:hypothetical protein MUK42_35253 [Musa troglodytarum]